MFQQTSSDFTFLCWFSANILLLLAHFLTVLALSNPFDTTFHWYFAPFRF